MNEYKVKFMERGGDFTTVDVEAMNPLEARGIAIQKEFGKNAFLERDYSKEYGVYGQIFRTMGAKQAVSLTGVIRVDIFEVT